MGAKKIYIFFPHTQHHGEVAWWVLFEKKVLDKYKALSLGGEEAAGVASEFLTRLAQHRDDAGSSGLWKELSFLSAYSLAESFLTTPRFGFGVCVTVAAHPLTTHENCAEMNPQVFGNFSFSSMEKRFVSPFPIGTGEAHFSSDEVDFTIARNASFFFFAKMKKKEAGGKKAIENHMFEKAYPFGFKVYKGLPPRKAASDVEDQFTLFTVEKKYKDTFSCFLRAGVFFKPLSDPLGISPFFSQCQVYSAEEKISRDLCFKIFGGDKACTAAPLIGSSFCEDSTVVKSCSPDGKTRILKFSKMDSVKGPENRSALLALLDQLRITKEVVPVF